MFKVANAPIFWVKKSFSVRVGSKRLLGRPVAYIEVCSSIQFELTLYDHVHEGMMEITNDLTNVPLCKYFQQTIHTFE